ncbi:hypothetical protein QBC36DRAFT_102690 [Triangularia setosa]|uniref:Uncharacterized protein n=1 Tax=Triangularia setosa TaxID=2587417 RepID=A0AAN6VZ27_9PEZI|nr:hypothetical protein QBC36DRAFT_102690 [Podospora setosa]
MCSPIGIPITSRSFNSHQVSGRMDPESDTKSAFIKTATTTGKHVSPRGKISHCAARSHVCNVQVKQRNVMHTHTRARTQQQQHALRTRELACVYVCMYRQAGPLCTHSPLTSPPSRNFLLVDRTEGLGGHGGPLATPNKRWGWTTSPGQLLPSGIPSGGPGVSPNVSPYLTCHHYPHTIMLRTAARWRGDGMEGNMGVRPVR